MDGFYQLIIVSMQSHNRIISIWSSNAEHEAVIEEILASTTLAVCHNRRIHSHQVFAKEAARGKSSVGWFYGFKLHLVVNDAGVLLACCLTAGNVVQAVA